MLSTSIMLAYADGLSLCIIPPFHYIDKRICIENNLHETHTHTHECIKRKIMKITWENNSSNILVPCTAMMCAHELCSLHFSFSSSLYLLFFHVELLLPLFFLSLTLSFAENVWRNFCVKVLRMKRAKVFCHAIGNFNWGN